jgi:hypothetical protein
MFEGGVAVVVFLEARAADKIIKEFNGVTLDG